MSDEAVSRALTDLRRAGIDPVELALRSIGDPALSKTRAQLARHVLLQGRQDASEPANSEAMAILTAELASIATEGAGEVAWWGAVGGLARLMLQRLNERMPQVAGARPLRLGWHEPLYDSEPFAGGGVVTPAAPLLFRDFGVDRRLSTDL